MIKKVKEFLLEKRQQFSIMGRTQDKEIFSIRRLSDNAFFELYLKGHKIVYRLYTGSYVRIIKFEDDLIHLRIENMESNECSYLIEIKELIKKTYFIDSNSDSICSYISNASEITNKKTEV